MKYLLTAVCLFSLTACAGASRHTANEYSLQPESTTLTNKSYAAKMVIGVGPIQLSNHLDRPQLTIKDERGLFISHSNHRWKSPLEDQIEQKLLSELAKMNPTFGFVSHPFKHPSDVDYQVYVYLKNFELDDDKEEFVLSLDYEVRYPSSKSVIIRRSFDVKRPLANTNFETQILEMRALLARLSEKIHQDIKNLYPKEATPRDLAIGLGPTED